MKLCCDRVLCDYFDKGRDQRGSNIGLAGCGMRLKIEAGCGIREILKAGCGIKTERRDRDMLCFVGGIRDRMGICEIIS